MKLIALAPLMLLVASATHAADDVDLKLGGSVMADYDSYADLFTENGTGSDDDIEIRRARLWLKGDLAADWQTKIQVDVSEGDEVEIKDAYLKYKGFDWLNLTVGKQKEPFGLEKTTSSRNTLMIERSMVTEALAPGRTNGVLAEGEVSQFFWQLGYFQDDNSERSNAVTGRLSWALQDDDDNFFHVGSAFSERSMHSDEFRINETLEVNTSDSLLEGETLQAEDMSLNSLELMGQYKGLVAMAEWQQADVDDDSLGTYRYEGGYYQMGYMLTQKNRRYKNGKLASIEADHDWELTARYSQFRLVEEDRKARTWSVGVNYHVTNDFKVMLNYIYAKHEEDGEAFGSDGAVALRVQYRF
ncbi:OprO/OprP family phosphate-selective porin [Neiella marina]|uniref:OprO/OprP family phosphate-selective porin n=1 Tax=Neiella holothuriorum TaxID=2870530 RepID=A0ABS7EC40_9GAMM|nr:porin [Neiella holothuriorum]MBW8189894.1 OprO/OprP family phosphate-selective porin [Neiella holothuriorum]